MSALEHSEKVSLPYKVQRDSQSLLLLQSLGCQVHPSNYVYFLYEYSSNKVVIPDILIHDWIVVTDNRHFINVLNVFKIRADSAKPRCLTLSNKHLISNENHD